MVDHVRSVDGELSVAGPSLFTIGYGARPEGEMFDLLSRHGVKYVVDLRSTPWSRFRPEFSQGHLVNSLRDRGVGYLFMGDELGGRPDDPSCYDEQGRVDYRACEVRPVFREAIHRLTRAWENGHPIALMCSEGKPEECHRTKLVAVALVEAGVDVRHIDERGAVLSHDEVLDRLRGSQTALLEDPGLVAKSRGRYRPAVST